MPIFYITLIKALSVTNFTRIIVSIVDSGVSLVICLMERAKFVSETSGANMIPSYTRITFISISDSLVHVWKLPREINYLVFDSLWSKMSISFLYISNIKLFAGNIEENEFLRLRICVYINNEFVSNKY